MPMNMVGTRGAKLLKSMSHPSRLMVLCYLMKGECTVSVLNQFIPSITALLLPWSWGHFYPHVWAALAPTALDRITLKPGGSASGKILVCAM
jgi:DNA-binding transcriptional ArsR family regulator